MPSHVTSAVVLSRTQMRARGVQRVTVVLAKRAQVTRGFAELARPARYATNTISTLARPAAHALRACATVLTRAARALVYVDLAVARACRASSRQRQPALLRVRRHDRSVSAHTARVAIYARTGVVVHRDGGYSRGVSACGAMLTWVALALIDVEITVAAVGRRLRAL